MSHNRQTAILASYLVLIKENKVLLSRRFNTGYEDGKYSLIAGHVDEGETFTQCIIREAHEEAGIIVQPDQLHVAHVMHRKNESEQELPRVDIYFVATEWSGEPQIKEPYKCDEFLWVDVENLPSNVIPCVRSAIKAISNNQSYSEWGW